MIQSSLPVGGDAAEGAPVPRPAAPETWDPAGLDFRAVCAQAAVGLAITDLRGRFVYVNPAFARLTGYTAAQLGATTAGALTHPADRAAHEQLHNELVAGTRSGIVVEQRYVHQDGRPVWVQNSMSVLRDAAGHPTHIIAWTVDRSPRRETEAALTERIRLAEFHGATGQALSRRQSLREMLQACTEAMVEHLQAAFARIWTLDPAADVLELQASAGLYTHLDGGHSRVAVGRLKIGQIAALRRPHLTNTVQHDPLVPEQAWAAREGLVAFAGYPLLVEDQLVGVMALFARRPLTDATLQAMATVASGIAGAIERKRAEDRRARLVAELRNERQRLESLLHLLPVPVLLIEPGTARVYFANRAADEMAGGIFPTAAAGEPLIGHHATDEAGALIPPAGMPGARAARGERLRGVEITWHLPAATKELLIHSELLPAGDGHPATVILTFDDITHLKEVEGALHRALRLRDDFLSIASHELKTPVTSIKAYAQILSRQTAGAGGAGGAGGVGGERLLRGLRTIVEQANRLTALINELLDVSRIATGRLALHYTPTDLGALITDVIAEVQLLTETHTFVLQPLPESPVVPADRDRLRQVLVNLLDNATKYSPAGGRVDVAVAARADALVVSVRDQGIGIPADQLPRIFDQFYRARNAAGLTYSGLGLGLHISQAIITDHGGQMWVESREGAGSCFAFALPRLRPASPDAAPPESPTG